MSNNPFYAAINAKLAEIIERTSPIWSDGWEKLGLTATGGERLAVYQAILDSGSVPAAAGLYLVFSQRRHDERDCRGRPAPPSR